MRVLGFFVVDVDVFNIRFFPSLPKADIFCQLVTFFTITLFKMM